MVRVVMKAQNIVWNKTSEDKQMQYEVEHCSGIARPLLCKVLCSSNWSTVGIALRKYIHGQNNLAYEPLFMLIDNTWQQ